MRSTRSRLLGAGLVLALLLLLRSLDAPTAPGPGPSSPGEEAPLPPPDPEPTGSGTVQAREDPGGPAAPGRPAFPHHVLVLDERGRPVAGAEVRAGGERSVTDASGRAGIPKLIGDMGMPSHDRDARTIHVSYPGYVPVNIKGWNREPHEVIRLLERGERLAGVCVDTAGRPVAGALLRTSGDWWDPGVEMRTDDRGRFETMQTPRRAQRLTLRHDVYLAEGIDVVPPQDGIVVTAVRPARISGVMRPPEDPRKSHYGAIRRLTLRPEREVRERFGSSGEFSIEFMPGAVELTWRRAVIARFDLAEGEANEGLEYPFPKPGIVPRVRSGPEEGHSLRLTVPAFEGTGTLTAGFGDGTSVIVDRKFASTGEEVPVSLPRADVRWVALDIWRNAAQTEVAEGAGRVSLPFGETSRVTGHLVDDEGRRVEEGSVSLRWPGTRRWARGADLGRDAPRPPDEEPPEGVGFLIAGVGPGRYDLVWSSPRLRDDVVLRRNVRMPDPPSALDLGTLTAAPKPYLLRVHVMDGSRRPIAGAIVTIRVWRPAVAVRTDRAGRIELPIHDRTGFAIEVSADGYEGLTRRIPTDSLPDRVEFILKPE